MTWYDSRWVEKIRSGLNFWFDPKRTGITICAILTVTGLIGAAQTGLFDRDEPRYAQSAREMLTSGDWLVPRFNGEPRLHKPIFIYWLMASFLGVLGDSALVARMPAILASAISAVLIHSLAFRWWGRKVAIWAVFVWATAPLTVVESRLATTDAVMNCQILGMMVCLTRLYGGPEIWTARLFWTLAGVSILTKGPVAVLFVVSGTAAAWLLTRIRIPRIWLRPVEGALITTMIVLPWLVAVTLRTDGAFLEFALGRELLGRTIAPAEGHSGFPGYYLVTLLFLFFPWSLFLPISIHAAWAKRKVDPRFAFLMGWAFGPLILLESISTRLSHYHYPSYAAFAILVSVQLAQLDICRARPKLMEFGHGLAVSLIAALALGIVAFGGLALIVPGSGTGGCLILSAIFGYALFRIMPMIRNGRWYEALRIIGVAWCSCLLIVIAWLVPVAQTERLPVKVADSLRRQESKIGSNLALGEFREPSLIHSLNRGHPLPILRREKDLRAALDRTGALLVPLSVLELNRLESMQDVIVQPLEKIDAMDWDRGKRRSITVCLLTRAPQSRLSQLSSVSDKTAVRSGKLPLRR